MVNIDDTFYDFVEYSTREACKKHNIPMVQIEYDNRRTKALGLARTNSNTIVMCCKSMRNYSYADVYHTILHEIAHIMQYDKYRGKITNPHGTEFFEMCRIVGIPEIQYHETEKVLARATQRAIEFRIK